VLFADILHFTSLADQQDFEMISDLVREVWAKLDAVIREYNGYIDKHIGDAIMVVWGAPRGACVIYFFTFSNPFSAPKII